MGLIIYVSLLLLTPKILSLPFDPQDNAFLSWAPSYTASQLNSGDRRGFPLTVPVTTPLHPSSHLCHFPNSISWWQLLQFLSLPKFPPLPSPSTRPPPPLSGASLALPPALLTGPHPIFVLSPSSHAPSEDPLKTLLFPRILPDTCLPPTHRVCHKVSVRAELKNLSRIQIKFRPRPGVQSSSCGDERKRRGSLRGASGLRVLQGWKGFLQGS